MHVDLRERDFDAELPHADEQVVVQHARAGIDVRLRDLDDELQNDRAVAELVDAEVFGGGLHQIEMRAPDLQQQRGQLALEGFQVGFIGDREFRNRLGGVVRTVQDVFHIGVVSGRRFRDRTGS